VKEFRFDGEFAGEKCLKNHSNKNKKIVIVGM
jgi:hypothetical protein